MIRTVIERAHAAGAKVGFCGPGAEQRSGLRAASRRGRDRFRSRSRRTASSRSSATSRRRRRDQERRCEGCDGVCRMREDVVWETIRKPPGTAARAEPFTWDACSGDARRAAGRRAQHRARGGRPACGRRSRRAGRDPLARTRGRAAGAELWRACGDAARFANVLAGHGLGRGDRVYVAARAGARALCRGARDAEGGDGVPPALRRLRARADPRTHGDRRGDRARDNPLGLPAQDRRLASQDPVAEAGARVRRGGAEGCWCRWADDGGKDSRPRRPVRRIQR